MKKHKFEIEGFAGDETKMSEEEIKKGLRDSLDYLDWISILHNAIENRKTSWNDNPVREWRNASDELLFAVKEAFEEKNSIPSQWQHIRNQKVKEK